MIRCSSSGPSVFLGQVPEKREGVPSRSGHQVYIGSWSIYLTRRPSRILGVRPRNIWRWAFVSKTLGSPAFRATGSRRDRLTRGGIEARIDDTVKLLKANKTARLMRASIAMENHAGDMHAGLVRLVEEAGKDWVGVNMDSGNAVWTLEDPFENLKIWHPAF